MNLNFADMIICSQPQLSDPFSIISRYERFYDETLEKWKKTFKKFIQI